MELPGAEPAFHEAAGGGRRAGGTGGGAGGAGGSVDACHSLTREA